MNQKAAPDIIWIRGNEVISGHAHPEGTYFITKPKYGDCAEMISLAKHEELVRQMQNEIAELKLRKCAHCLSAEEHEAILERVSWAKKNKDNLPKVGE